MHSRLLLAGLLALAVAPAAASADLRTVTVDPASPTAAWDGTPAPGANMTFYEGETTGLAACGSDPHTYCDDTLVHFTSATELEESDLRFRIDGYEVSDYDLRVYTSDKTGAEGEHLGDPTGEGNGPLGAVITTFWGDHENLTTFAEPDSWYLVRVVYFTSPGTENYKGTVSWTGGPPTQEDEG